MSYSRSDLVETLENRRLYSAGAFLAHSILHVNGDFSAANAIQVDDNGTAVTVSIDYTTRKGVPKTFTATFVKTLEFSKVVIRGGFKGDTISVGQNSSTPFSKPTRIEGIAGHDTITTAAERDTIIGGLGSCVISSGDGDDIVHGGFGSNHITVGNGNDKVRGGAGRNGDVIVAGNGNDTIVCGAGADSVVVGDGNNVVHGQAGADTIVAGNGNDSLWGGRGDDSIMAGNGTDTFGGLLGSNTLLGGTGSDTFVVRANFPIGQTTSYNAAKDHLDTRHGEAATPVT